MNVLASLLLGGGGTSQMFHCSPDMKDNLEWSLTILAQVAKKYCLPKEL
jgi:hypothetical protein